MSSFTPVRVTVWAVLQFELVRVTEVGESVPSVASEVERGMVTSAVGSELRTMVKVAVPPASVVIRPVVVLRIIPLVSSFRFMKDGSDASSPL